MNSVVADDLVERSAVVLGEQIRHGEVSAREVLDAHIARIESTNADINAFTELCIDRSQAEAHAADNRLARGDLIGPLHGLPIAHKDLIETAGVRTTFGSTAFADYIPTTDAPVVERAAGAGAIMLGKTNTPEFGTGGHTRNELFGLTRNPVDLRRSAGGSSGGSAAALAAGYCPLATGTDMAGSLRIPASFCGVVGFRPTPGAIPHAPNKLPYFPYAVAGPMGRTVGDVQLLFDVLAGASPLDPLSSLGPRTASAAAAAESLRMAWCPDAFELPVDPGVQQVLGNAMRRISGPVDLETAPLTLPDVDELFRTWRAWYYQVNFAGLNDSEGFSEKTRSEINRGGHLTIADLERAEKLRADMVRAVAAIFAEFDVLLLPATPVTAFPAEQTFPTTVGGEQMPDYLAWMRHLYFVTAMGVPALCLPVGKTGDGLPVGIQVVTRPGTDHTTLDVGKLVEQILTA